VCVRVCACVSCDVFSVVGNRSLGKVLCECWVGFSKLLDVAVQARFVLVLG
jgi:hypothetical protein